MFKAVQKVSGLRHRPRIITPKWNAIDQSTEESQLAFSQHEESEAGQALKPAAHERPEQTNSPDSPIAQHFDSSLNQSLWLWTSTFSHKTWSLTVPFPK